MTPDALHKRAERQRRREAGEVRVEVWLSAEAIAVLDANCIMSGSSRSQVMNWILEPKDDQ